MDVTDMISELNDHGFTDTTSSRKVSMLNDALWDAASRWPWPFLETSLDLNFNGASAIPTNLPSNLGPVIDVVDVSNQNYRLDPKTVDDLDRTGTDYTTVGPAQTYYFIGNSLYLWPIPPATTGGIRLRYYKVPAALTDTTLSAAIEWPVRHHRVLVLGALYRLYDLEDDPELSARFQQHYETRLQQMLQDVFMRQYDRTEYVRVDADFDLDFYA